MEQFYNVWIIEYNRWTNATHSLLGYQSSLNPFCLTKDQAEEWATKLKKIVSCEVRPIPIVCEHDCCRARI